jgi:hypothetical protein
MVFLPICSCIKRWFRIGIFFGLFPVHAKINLAYLETTLFEWNQTKIAVISVYDDQIESEHESVSDPEPGTRLVEKYFDVTFRLNKFVQEFKLSAITSWFKRPKATASHKTEQNLRTHQAMAMELFCSILQIPSKKKPTNSWPLH